MENGTRVTVNKKAALTILFLLVGAVLLFVWYANVRAVQPFSNCTQLKAALGHGGITRDSPYYNPALDRDHDNVACE